MEGRPDDNEDDEEDKEENLTPIVRFVGKP